MPNTTQLREAIARAIYEDPMEERSWDDVSEERRIGWLADGDRVITALIELKIVDAKQYA